ncbi:MAG TPA: GNAT family N-acetyltransferase [Chloroflexia bacterium]|nr:GNAT family N-acetyltransferase [Chloroflexia bacterium]
MAAPSPAYQVGSLAPLSLAALVALVNQAYVGYPGPFSPEDPVGYAGFCRVQQIDLARSVLAQDRAGAAIGVGLLGIRGPRGWCGEFGVVPAWRRQGVGRALLAALLAQARAAGLQDVRLEVAAANAPARRLYESAGFQVRRALQNYAAGAAALGLAGFSVPPDVRVAPADFARLVAESGLLAGAGAEPAWDHELPALLAGDPAPTLLATRAGQPVGLLQYTGDPLDVELRLLAVPSGDLAIARALLATAVPRPGARLVVAYVDAASPLATLLPALGFRALEPDLEMHYVL